VTDEARLTNRPGESEEKQQQDEIIYAGYVDEWQRRADLDHWGILSSW
jgi:hypothetical protein